MKILICLGALAMVCAVGCKTEVNTPPAQTTVVHEYDRERPAPSSSPPAVKNEIHVDR